jgi:hypothetical protein
LLCRGTRTSACRSATTGQDHPYEGHLSRQLYQAKHELEVLQKQRRGERLARVDVQGATERVERAAEARVYEVKTITPLNP